MFLGGTPWEKKVPVVVGRSDFPKQVILHISNMVYVSKSGFQESALALLKRLCAFVNPQYKIAQNSRRSTYGIHQIIDCGYEDDRFIGIPRGYLEKVEALFERYGVPYEVEDERCCGKPISVSFTGTLRPLQEEAVEALLREETGILEAEPSFGKTVTALGLIARRGINTLVIVHTGALLNQWRKSIEQFLGVKAGQVGQQKNKRTNIIDVAIFASLVEGDENGDKRVKPMVSEYGMVIVDECHHTSARTYEMVLREVRAKYVYELSATPQRRMVLHRLLLCSVVLCGINIGWRRSSWKEVVFHCCFQGLQVLGHKKTWSYHYCLIILVKMHFETDRL